MAKYETTGTENIVCPYCGWEDVDSWEAPNEDKHAYCPECDKTFEYDSEQLGRQFNSWCTDENHKFEHDPSSKTLDCYRCIHCDQYEFKDQIIDSLKNWREKLEEYKEDKNRLPYIEHNIAMYEKKLKLINNEI